MHPNEPEAAAVAEVLKSITSIFEKEACGLPPTIVMVTVPAVPIQFCEELSETSTAISVAAEGKKETL